MENKFYLVVFHGKLILCVEYFWSSWWNLNLQCIMKVTELTAATPNYVKFKKKQKKITQLSHILVTYFAKENVKFGELSWCTVNDSSLATYGETKHKFQETWPQSWTVTYVIHKLTRHGMVRLKSIQILVWKKIDVASLANKLRWFVCGSEKLNSVWRCPKKHFASVRLRHSWLREAQEGEISQDELNRSILQYLLNRNMKTKTI